MYRYQGKTKCKLFGHFSHLILTTLTNLNLTRFLVLLSLKPGERVLAPSAFSFESHFCQDCAVPGLQCVMRFKGEQWAWPKQCNWKQQSHFWQACLPGRGQAGCALRCRDLVKPTINCLGKDSGQILAKQTIKRLIWLWPHCRCESLSEPKMWDHTVQNSDKILVLSDH